MAYDYDYDYEGYVNKPRINQPPYLIDIRQRQPARREQRQRIESTEQLNVFRDNYGWWGYPRFLLRRLSEWPSGRATSDVNRHRGS